MKEKNKSAVELGRKSAEVRFKGKTKKERKDAMKTLWLKSLKARGIASVHLTNK